MVFISDFKKNVKKGFCSVYGSSVRMGHRVYRLSDLPRWSDKSATMSEPLTHHSGCDAGETKATVTVTIGLGALICTYKSNI
jgi:hypothetical protein